MPNNIDLPEVTIDPLATKLLLVVENSLDLIAKRQIIPDNQNPDEINWLQICRQSILDGNHILYRESLSQVIRNVLTNLSQTLIEELALAQPETDAEPTNKHLVLLSFHVSSVQLRKWFRVISPITAWSQTDYKGSEIDFFENIYDWDSRYGHILTDPEMPSALDATFGATIDLMPDWNGSDKEYRFKCAGRTLWDKAYKLVKSPIFTLLVDHELDKYVDSNQLKEALKNFPQFKDRERDEFATDIEILGNAIKGLWPQEANVSIAIRARSFLLSFFYTVGRPRNFCERIIASSVMPICSEFSGNRKIKTGSLAIVISGTTPSAVEGVELKSLQIQPAATALAHAVAELEHRVLFERIHDGRISLTEEDTIRQACEVDYLSKTDLEIENKEPSFEQLFRLCRPLHEEIATRLIERHCTNKIEKARAQDICQNTRLGQCIKLPTNLAKDKTIVKLLEECGIVGTSRCYVQLIRELATAAEIDDLSETRVIFLESEPGCGKEMLAKLIHLFSIRAHLDMYSGIQVSGESGTTVHNLFKQRLHSVFNGEQNTFLRGLICQDQKDSTINTDSVQEHFSTNPLSPEYSKSRLFNYFTLNMAALTNEERFLKQLFGCYANRKSGTSFLGGLFGKNKDINEVELSVIGRCFLAYALTGTVFLDEFNTLPVKEWANVFLRLLEKPFEMEIPGRQGGPLRDAKMLIIFASNKTREELIEAGFNEAVIYRVTKTRIRIPPLRERPADIAVFVNALVRKHNEKRSKANEKHFKEQIRRIDIQAMRLLCELRWSDNYRGVQGLMDDVLGDRIQRRIAHPELTFDEILHGLRRREAFQAAVSRGKVEVVEHLGRK